MPGPQNSSVFFLSMHVYVEKPVVLMISVEVVESSELAVCSHLRSNEPVLGLSIADQINVLAVTHLQELQYAALRKKGFFHANQSGPWNRNSFSA